MISVSNSAPRLFYSHPHGEIWLGDSIEWLRSLDAGSVDLVFADPPYNIKKAEWDTFESQQEYVAWSVRWIEQAARVLKPTGTLYVCGFSEILADLRLPASRFFKGCRWLVWHYKNKANLGDDWGRSHESILHFRKSHEFTFNVDDVRIPYGDHTLKYPAHPQAETSQYGKGCEQRPHLASASARREAEGRAGNPDDLQRDARENAAPDAEAGGIAAEDRARLVQSRRRGG